MLNGPKALALAALVCVAGNGWSQEVSKPGEAVSAQLLTDVTAVEPGKPFNAGILFRIQPNWHIYWKNPGETGYATSVKWDTPPADLKVQETLYPAPISFVSQGPVTGYGYEGEVLLITPMVLNAGTNEKEVTLKGKVRWLQCSAACVPGKADVTLRVPVGKAAPANAALFQKYQKLVPTAAKLTNVTAQAKSEVGATTVQIQVTPSAGGLVAKDKAPAQRQLYFFPEKLEGYEVGVPAVRGSQQTVKTATGTVPVYKEPVTIAVKLTPSEGAKPALQLYGVLVQQAVDAQGDLQAPQVSRISIALGAK